jgi:hypothetical protein
MNDNVISFGSRKPWREEKAAERRQKKSEGQRRRRDKTEAQKELRETTLETLDKVRALVTAGKLEGLVIVARDPVSKHFLTDVCFDERVTPTGDMFAWAGVLATLEMEVKENATMAPSVQLDGTIIDPEVETTLFLMEEGFE